jgi:hypothetical protein
MFCGRALVNAPILAAMSTALTPALRNAGFALAHGIGSIKLGGTLCTLAVGITEGRRTIYRYEARSIVESLAAAHGHLAHQIGTGAYAALVYDGFVTSSERERTDALMVEILGPHGLPMGRVAQAYEPGRRFGLPFVGRTCSVLGSLIIEEVIDHDDPASAIYEGIREYPYGARLFRLPPQSA